MTAASGEWLRELDDVLYCAMTRRYRLPSSSSRRRVALTPGNRHVQPPQPAANVNAHNGL